MVNDKYSKCFCRGLTELTMDGGVNCAVIITHLL